MIAFKNVCKTFGSHRVLDELSFEIPDGEICFIVGKSGEGKSVTIKHIMGLLTPDQGSILVNGKQVDELEGKDLHAYRKQLGMLFQHAALFDSLSVEENVLFPLKETSLKSRAEQLEIVAKTLEQVGLPGSGDKYPSQLSTGEKKRVGLARALVTKPKILLYDEPTTGMDPLISEMIDELIVQTNHNNPGMTSIVISHDLKAALATAERIIMLYKGRVALSGTPQEFKTSKDPVVRQFFSGKVEGPIEFF